MTDGYVIVAVVNIIIIIISCAAAVNQQSLVTVALSIALIGSILNALAQIFVGARNYR